MTSPDAGWASPGRPVPGPAPWAPGEGPADAAPAATSGTSPAVPGSAGWGAHTYTAHTHPAHTYAIPVGSSSPYGAPTAPGQVPSAPPRPTARRRRRTMSTAWAVPLVALSLAAGLVGGLLGSSLARNDRLADAGLPAVPTAAPAGASDGPTFSVAEVAAAVLPSVVSLEVVVSDGVVTGSGFVLRADGYLLTNHHVVADAIDGGGDLTVTLADGREVAGRVVGSTSEYDLAVVKVDLDGLTPLLLGDSDAVVVGDPVVAIGSPLGLTGTVTSGIVSAVHRPVQAGQDTDTAFIDAIQTDAAVNPGNSGGPLVDSAGRVIGVASAIAQPPGATSDSAGSIGLGFAIPSNQARRTADQLIETGRATYPVIGVLLDDTYSGEGVRVSLEDPMGREAVVTDGPADRAGIVPGDIILSIDGRPVTAPDELIVAIRARTPGDTVLLHVRSGTRERDVSLVLDEVGTG